MHKIVLFAFLWFVGAALYAQNDAPEITEQTYPSSTNYSFIVTYFNRTYFMSWDYIGMTEYKTADKKTKARIDFLHKEYNTCDCILTVLANYGDNENLELVDILKKDSKEILSIYKTYHGGGKYIYGSCYNPLPGVKLIDIEYLKAFVATPQKGIKELLVFDENILGK